MIDDQWYWYDSNISKRKDSYLLTLTYLTDCYWFVLKITITTNILQLKQEVSILYFLWCLCHSVTHIQNLSRQYLCALPFLEYCNRYPMRFWMYDKMTKVLNLKSKGKVKVFVILLIHPENHAMILGYSRKKQADDRWWNTFLKKTL